MIRIFLTSLAFVCVAASGTISAQTDVRVLSYNIHRDIGGADSTTSAQPSLAKIVNALKPDIWTISELGGNDASFSAATAHAQLAAFVHDQLSVFGSNAQENINYFIYISTIDDGYDTVAIVSRYPFASTHTYSDAGAGFSALRGLALASVTVQGGTNLDVFTTHLKADNTTSDASRRQSKANTDSTNIAAWITAHPADAVVVTGDWNETEEPGETTNWSDHGIGDTLRTPRGPYHPITTMRSAGLIDPGSTSIAGDRDTINASNPNARFDYAMYASSRLVSSEVFDTKQYTAAQLAAFNLANGTHLVPADSSAASDHLPVISIVRVGFQPVILSSTRQATDLAVTYQLTTTPTISHSIEESADLVTWRPASFTDTLISQTADAQTIRSSVPLLGRDRLFLRVRAKP